ncbi:type II secretion system F family protein (plasmid) [Halopseudomonas sp. SMJS2]|uniref:type II secretion system F family protein n=1 Tax=Halopseudomonas sp. SMJS2 TaxID=3041098 RepID=UPI002452E374|nr:type II secretion system F family protein [Halopseudomonas sp. SMJS2]WGK63353.1 type II secretion system F family protein [Halopseudomonas sp. SMJS2]
MAYFLIKYLGQSGGLESISAEAETKEQAMQNCGLPLQLIDSVVPDHFGGIKAALLEKKLPLVEQALNLSAISSKLESGKTFAKAIEESIDYKKLGVSSQKLDACAAPKDYLELLRFDDTAILLADAGDKAGRLPESLTRAATSIKEREATRKEFGKAMMQGVMYITLGFLFLIGIPLFAGSTLHDFITVQRIPLTLNNLSHVIMTLYGLYTGYYMVIGAVLVAIYMFRSRIWDMTRTLPLLRFFNERAKIKRGLDFVESYQLLLSSGYTNPQSLRFLHQRSKGKAHLLYAEALDRLEEGNALSRVFENTEWPPILYQNLQGFEEQSPGGRDKVLSNLAGALKEYYLLYSGRISRLCLMTGMTFILVSILLFAVGFYMPLISLNQGLQ